MKNFKRILLSLVILANISVNMDAGNLFSSCKRRECSEVSIFDKNETKILSYIEKNWKGIRRDPEHDAEYYFWVYLNNILSEEFEEILRFENISKKTLRVILRAFTNWYQAVF